MVMTPGFMSPYPKDTTVYTTPVVEGLKEDLDFLLQRLNEADLLLPPSKDGEQEFYCSWKQDDGQLLYRYYLSLAGKGDRLNISQSSLTSLVTPVMVQTADTAHVSGDSLTLDTQNQNFIGELDFKAKAELLSFIASAQTFSPALSLLAIAERLDIDDEDFCDLLSKLEGQTPMQLLCLASALVECLKEEVSHE